MKMLMKLNSNRAPQRLSGLSVSPRLLLSNARPVASLMVLAACGALGALSAVGLSAPVFAAQPGTTLPPNVLPQLRAITFGQATVNAPSATATGSLLRIDQTTQQLILDWNSFNISKGSEVRFYQPNATAEALNRIFDQDPSIIQGKLTANGRVYLLNSNGILFDKDSQVDTRGLIASSLAISEAVFKDGVFKDRGLTPTFEGTLRLDSNGNAIIDPALPTGSVTNLGILRNVDPDSGAAPGGFVMLFAPKVGNEGLIVSDNGQVVLAAGAKVYLKPNLKKNTTDTLDITMRGMVVEIQAGDAPLDISSLVENLGTLQAARGNVTMAGLAVNQKGRVSASTAVNQNGSIWLLAREKPDSVQRAGTLTLGQGSVTETPLVDDGTTLADSQSYDPFRARVRLEGKTVDVQGSVIAKGGIVSLGNTQQEYLGNNDPRTAFSERVLLGANALIDVSGSYADLALAKNLLTFRLTTDDLKNSPVQKGGYLLGKTVTVDMRKSNPLLFDITAATANVRRGIFEKAAVGGDITVTSNDFISLASSTVDYSGGGYRYAAGQAPVTRLISGGKQYEINTAPTDLVYTDGIGLSGIAGQAAPSSIYVNHAKWDVTEVFSSPLAALTPVSPAYVDGKAAGSFTIDAANIALEGAQRASVTAGPYQRDVSKIPAGGKLVLGNSGALVDSRLFRLGDVVFQTPQNKLSSDFGIDSALPNDRVGKVQLAPDIYGTSMTDAAGNYTRSGPTKLEIYANGKFEVASGVSVDAPVGSSLNVFAHQVEVNGDIRLPSGVVSLKAVNTNSGTGDATLSVADGSTVSTAGLWVNETLPGVSATRLPFMIDGGSIDLSGFGVDLGTDSILDVSGGARLGSDRKIATGKAGSIALSSTFLDKPINLDDFGTLNLGGELRGYSAGTSDSASGGKLSLLAGTVRIGGTGRRNEGDLWLDPEFFRNGGFAAHSVTGYFDLEVADNTQVQPLVKTRAINLNSALSAATGTAFDKLATAQVLPAELRPAGSLTLKSSYEPGRDSSFVAPDAATPGGLRLGTGASISTDPGATVTLASQSRLNVDGTIDAPAGTINLKLRTETNTTYGGETLRLGSNARLNARGAFIAKPNVAGRVDGKLLGGGQVNFDVKKNDLLLESGSVIDVSGVSAQIDLPVSGGGAVQRMTLGSAAGTITVKATENVRMEGTFLAHGGTNAAGGALAVDSISHEDIDPSAGQQFDNLRHTITLTQTNAVPAITADIRNVSLNVDALHAGGIEKLRLAAKDAIEFKGDINLTLARSLQLDAPEIAGVDSAQVTIAAPQVKLSNTPANFRPNNGFSPVATRSGDASLAITADLLEFAGHVTLNGFADSRLASRGDLRGIGFPVLPSSTDVTATRQALTGSLTTPGNLTLAAGQIYPSTAVDYTFAVDNPDSLLKVEKFGGTAQAPVLSAGGKLRFNAAHIVHDGVVKAPLGAVEFNAGQDLLLTDNSLTSVSAEGRVIPFGQTLNGENLFYGAIDYTALPPEKRIALNAPRLTVAPQAQLDVSGGGDFQAVEFVPGIGGSNDALLAANTYAIVPGLRFAPSDSALAGLKDLGFGSDSAIYDSVEIAAGGLLPAGRYALLPGYYALLPGSYVVTRQTNSALQDLPPGTTLTLPNGSRAVAGKLASSASGVTEARWSGFVVRPGQEILRESEYRVGGSDFYVNAAKAAGTVVPRLPVDAGTLAIAATDSLALGGVLKALPGTGGGIGRVDIAAPKIAVVSQLGQANTPAGFVEIEADRLTQFGASVLLGGTRSETVEGTLVNVVSSEVKTLNDSDHVFTAPELILAARDQVSVEAGSVLEGKGRFNGEARDLLIQDATDNSGALLRLSSSKQVAVLRDASRGAGLGLLDVASGAELRTDQSLLLDATTTTTTRGTLVLPRGGAASFSGSNISLGQTAAVSDGLVIDQTQLNDLGRLAELTLRGYSSLDLYGDMTFGGADFGKLTIDAPTIAGHLVGGSNQATLDAQSLVLQNTSASAPAAATTGTGALTLRGKQITLGKGDKSIAGFDSVNLAAAQEIVGSDSGLLTAGGDLTLETPRLTSAAKSQQSLKAQQDDGTWRNVAITRPVAPAELVTAAPVGGKLSILGKRIENSGTIDMQAGILELGARGAGADDGVLLADGAQINLGGFAKQLGDQTVVASGGTLTLSADHGAIQMNSGAGIDLSGAVINGTQGGNAGELVVRAPEGRVELNGILEGTAAPGAATASASLDVARLDNLAALNSALAAAGFTNKLNFRARGGDVAISAGDTLRARNVKVVADAGSISIAGRIDVSAASGGGKAELIARDDLQLLAGSTIDARGTGNALGAADAYSHGGRVELTTTTGVIDMDAAASIDASAVVDGKSDGGEIRFVAPRSTRTDSTPGVAMNLAGRVAVNAAAGRSAGSVMVEGSKRYDGIADTTSSVDALAGNPVWEDYAAFASNTTAIRDDLGLRNADGSLFDKNALRVRAGIELASVSDMSHSTTWDLTQSDWRIGSEAGRLTLRSAGNLDIGGALGFPDDNLPSGPTWDLRLVGGADVGSADAMATVASTAQGDVTLSTASSKVRTGDGDISIAAGRDFRITDFSAVVYTAGTPTIADENIGRFPNRFSSGGGDISISAGRDAVGSITSTTWINDWLRRGSSSTFQGRDGLWWTNRQGFRHNIGALGGGNIDIQALGAVTNLSAVIPTSGRLLPNAAGTFSLDPVTTQFPNEIAVAGGGNLAVVAGGDVSGGDYLIGRGDGVIRSGGDFGKTTPTTLFLMGESDDTALRHAAFTVEARGDVNLQAASNPTILPLTTVSSNTGQPGYASSVYTFFTYSPDSAVSLLSVGGGVTVGNEVDPRGVAGRASLSSIFPAQVSMAALQGNVTGGAAAGSANTEWRPFSSTETSVKLLAGQDVLNQTILFGDALPSAFPMWQNPSFGSASSSAGVGSILNGIFTGARVIQPNSDEGYRYAVVAERGDIRESRFQFSQAALIQAGADIRNVTFDLQNLATDDLSVIRAGRDLKYTSFTAANQLVGPTSHFIRVGGPGRLLVQAGRNIDFGNAAGIDAVGNFKNSSLPDGRSAALTVMAGVKGEISQAAIDKLFADIKVAGLAADSIAGDAAIAALFGSGANLEGGHINMVQSGIQTRGDSSIDILAPQGGIDVGLATEQVSKLGPDGLESLQIGVITAAGGGINTLVRDDINVNLSRIVTLLGGDVLVYAQRGNIDAGRGPRDSVSSLAPQVDRILAPNSEGTLVDSGLRRFRPPVDAAGSGMRTVSFDPDGPSGPILKPEPGSVFLFASRGFVDAGEAGVNAAGNIVVVAQQVLNASNFSAGGSSSGVPASNSGSISGALAAASGAAAGAANVAESAARNASTRDSFRPTFITVEVLGLGDA